MRFWSFVKSRRQDNNSVHLLQQNLTTISDSFGKANLLNGYFHSIFTKEYITSIQNSDPNLSNPNIDQIIITSTGILKLLDSLNVTKADSPDNLPVCILKELSSELAPILAQLFQQSLDQGVLPDDWRTANVVPVFKKDKRSLVSNYRPISLTSITCQVLEHIIYHHICKHLENHYILTDFQHGFRKRRNCETQLIVALHDLVSAVNKGNQVDALVLDFTRHLIEYQMKDCCIS